MSQFAFFQFGQNISFRVLSKFEFLNSITIQVFEFCHNLSLRVLSKFNFWVWFQFEFLSFVSIWVLSQIEFFSLSKFKLLSFVTIWVVESCHNLSFWVLYQFDCVMTCLPNKQSWKHIEFIHGMDNQIQRATLRCVFWVWKDQCH